MAAEFLAQAGASRSLLNSLRGRPAFALVSRNEKDRLHAMLLRARGMAAAHLAELAEAIKQAEFAKPDDDALLDVISELAIQSSPSIAIAPTRTALQDWQSLCNDCPASCWESMGVGKLEDAIDFLLLLGLRNPTESTTKVLVLSILCAPNCIDNAIGATQETKLAVTKTVRTLFRQRANN